MFPRFSAKNSKHSKLLIGHPPYPLVWAPPKSSMIFVCEVLHSERPPFAVTVLVDLVELLHDQLPPRAGDRPVLGRRQLRGGGRGARLHPQILQHVDGESALI